MSTNKFERFARKKLEQDSYPVDVEALWEAIEPEVRPRKRRRFLFLWISIGFGLLVSLFLFSKNEKAAEENSISFSEKESVNIAEVKTYPLEKIVGEKQVTAPTSNTKKEDLTLVKTNSFFPTQIPTTNINSEVSTFVNDEIQETETKTPVSIDQPARQESNLVLTPEINRETEQDDKVERELKEQNTIAVLKDEKVDPIESDFLFEKKEAETEEEAENVLEKPKENEKTKVLKQLTLGGGIRGGISNQFVNLSTKDPIGEIILQNRAETETHLEVSQIGLEALLKFKSKWYLRTGIDYQRAVTRFQFNGQLIEQEEVQGLVKTIENPFNGIITNQYGLVSETTETKWNKEIFNKTHFVNTPVIFGFEYPFSKWSLGIEAGTQINWSIRQSGQIRDELSFYYLKEDSENWFKNKAELSWLGSIHVGYLITPKTQLLVSTVYNSPITISDKNNPVTQKQSSIGLQVAARYWLLRK